MNGVPNLSVLDGSWLEGYRPAQGDRPANGWAFGEVEFGDPNVQDEADSQSLYRIFEEEVVPLHFARDAAGVPHRWVQVMKRRCARVPQPLAHGACSKTTSQTCICRRCAPPDL